MTPMRSHLVFLISLALALPALALSAPAAAKPPAQAAAAPATVPALAQTAKPDEPAAPETGRDPFKTLILPPSVGVGKAAAPDRPPGKAGLGIDDLTVQGVAVGGPTGPVALVAGRGGQTYFLRPGDEIFDGEVTAIRPDGVVFRRTRAVYKGQSAGEEAFRAVAGGGEAAAAAH